MFDVVYFSSVSENTKRFVDKLDAAAIRIPIRTEEAAEFVHDRDSVLVLPTYGGGNDNSTVPKQVIKFLNNPDEITGTPEDVIEVKERLAQFWQIQS